MSQEFRNHPYAGPAMGQTGTLTETGTTAKTGIDAYAIQMLADTVFSALTDGSADDGGDAMTGFTLPAGMIIFGKFNAFTLTSGKVRAYLVG